MSLSPWTALDYVFTVVILISTILALTKGLTREITSMVALIGGFYLAVFFYPVLGVWFKEFTSTLAIANLLGFVLIFVGCLLIGALVAYLINRFIKMASLQWMDRVLGGVFGFIRGWLISSIIVLGLVAFPVRQNLLARSVLAPYLLAGARAAVLVVPPELKEKFNEGYQKVLQLLNQPQDPE
jgi:membrane protein required for colicin V production